MAKTLSQIGVETNYLVRAWHVSQSIDALTGADDYDITISGSLTTTGSLYFSGLETSSTNNILTYDSTTGEVTYSPTTDLVVDTALTASYVDLVAGLNITINQVGTSFEISSSAEHTNTGSFTGSFTGNLLGTASYVNLKAGPNITINQTGNVFEISSSAEAISTGSFLITASIASNTITFTKGDSSTFPIVVYNDLKNITPTTSIYQIPSGNCRIIIDPLGLPGWTDYYIKLPTSLYSVGDFLEIIYLSPPMGGTPFAINPVTNYYYTTYITQPAIYQQILNMDGQTSTLGLTGGVNYISGFSLRLLCITSGTSTLNPTQWIISNYTAYIGDSTLTLY